MTGVDLRTNPGATASRADGVPPFRRRSVRIPRPDVFSITRALFRFRAVRAAVALCFLTRGAVMLPFDRFRALVDFCWVSRVSRVRLLARVSNMVVNRAIAQARTGPNPFVRAFLASKARSACHERFLAGRAGLDSVFRDIIVLKAPRPNEKGVMLLKYTPKFELFVSLFDLDRITNDYHIVLEPCWAGYCDPAILMFVSPGKAVLVQCPDDQDYEYIQSLRSNLIPVRLGASDWVDPDLFSPRHESEVRRYDLIMVANWGRHKNHRRLFEALTRVERRPLSVLLVGFEWAGRTHRDIEAEMQRYDLRGIMVEFRNGVPAADVARYLRQSKVFVLLSEKEGSNKAIVEALFCDVPAIVYDKFIGGATSKINPQTGVLASFDQVGRAIEYMLCEYEKFTPRAWALAHSGSRTATRTVNAIIRDVAFGNGESWTTDLVEKVNRPNLAYKIADPIPPAHQAAAIAPAYLR